MRPAAALLITLVAMANLSCAVLDGLVRGGTLTPPTVRFDGARLAQAPSRQMASAYFCPRVLRERVGFGSAAEFACGRLFGAAPAREQMTVGFDLDFTVSNPNGIPLPVSELLTAITLFPDSSRQSLGAVCLTLCEGGSGPCPQTTRSCRDAPGDIKTIDDLPGAALSMLIAQGLSAAAGTPASFRLPQVTAGSSLTLTARFAIAPEALFPALEELARRSMAEIERGQEISFAIPYGLEGTLFADAGSLGRVAAAFGPGGGTWTLPTTRLLGTD